MGTESNEMNGGGGDRVDRIAADIDETRGELTDTVREIGTRLEPANLAREARETVRGATIGKVEMMSMGAQDTWRDVRTGNAGGIVDMVRENPVPAGMIGLGLALMFLNRGSRSSMGNGNGAWTSGRASGRASSRYRYGADAYGRDPYAREVDWYESSGGSSPVDRVGAMADDAREAMGDAGRRIGDTMSDFGDSVSDFGDSVGRRASDLPQQAGSMVDTGTYQARRMLEENPLGAGILAVAAGAAIGMLLPTTPFERETVGPMRDQVVDQVASAAEDTIDTAKSSMQSSSSSSSSGTEGSASRI